MTLMMRYCRRIKYPNVYYFVLQPVAEEPFTFITELDDLPKDKLKCKGSTMNIIIVNTIKFLFADMIHEEAIKFVCYLAIIIVS